jgi:hypothetical protein
MTELHCKNGVLLEAAKIPVRWDKPGHNLVVTCLCGGRLFIHETEDWKWCFGDLKCRAADLSMTDLIEKLKVREQAE